MKTAPNTTLFNLDPAQSFSEEELKFMALLQEDYSWPDYFTFRFILKSHQVAPVEQLLKQLRELESAPVINKITHQESKEAKYLRLSFRAAITHEIQIIAIYRYFAQIPDLIKI